MKHLTAMNCAATGSLTRRGFRNSAFASKTSAEHGFADSNSSSKARAPLSSSASRPGDAPRAPRRARALLRVWDGLARAPPLRLLGGPGGRADVFAKRTPRPREQRRAAPCGAPLADPPVRPETDRSTPGPLCGHGGVSRWSPPDPHPPVK